LLYITRKGWCRVSDIGLGKLIVGSANRDAIHIAVAPVTATETLFPGNYLVFCEHGSVDKVKAVDRGDDYVGVVDPFLQHVVLPGERFWMYLKPGSITSLRHDWTHPDFREDAVVPKVVDKSASESWLRSFCSTADCPDYAVVLAAAVGDPVAEVGGYGEQAYYNDGEYLTFIGREAHSEIPDEFWEHVEVVTGKKCTLRPKYFSCSC